jgi:hypothetical protein
VGPTPTRSAHVADGQWHRFGESADAPRQATPASPARGVTNSRATDPPATRNLQLADGQWHRFREGR